MARLPGSVSVHSRPWLRSKDVSSERGNRRRSCGQPRLPLWPGHSVHRTNSARGAALPRNAAEFALNAAQHKPRSNNPACACRSMQQNEHEAQVPPSHQRLPSSSSPATAAEAAILQAVVVSSSGNSSSRGSCQPTRRVRVLVWDRAWTQQPMRPQKIKGFDGVQV